MGAYSSVNNFMAILFLIGAIIIPALLLAYLFGLMKYIIWIILGIVIVVILIRNNKKSYHHKRHH